MWREFLAFAVLVCEARSQCLPNASLPADRKNLFNVLTGESYPIGLWENGNYPAAKLATQVLQILIQEILNYHVELKGTSSLNVDSFFALMGCLAPLNSTDRRCGSRVSYVHICVESWTSGYQTEWDRIQIQHPQTAPKLLGNMGYFGVSDQYVPLAIQQSAYMTEGLNLDFYREYNISWRNPARYFTSPGDLNVSRLLPCRESGLMDSEIIRSYVDFSGDWDGVVADDDSVVAKCFHEYFWYAPACRANSSACLTWLTGGSGWGLIEIMPKAAAFNIPLAAAVAASFENYASLPEDFKLMLYWWTPDPTFIRLNPRKIIFPEYDEKTWAKGDRTAQAAGVSIDKLVSQDLATVAPQVEEFMSRFRLSLQDMNDMLLNQVNTKDSDFDIACNWLLSNADWSTWIPEKGKCFSQYGMYNEKDEVFLTTREDVAIVCKVCPSGTYSSQLEDNEGITYTCTPCASGSFQPSGGAESCSRCPAGSYQDETGSIGCNRCPIGEYQDEEGQQTCKACPLGATTLLLGSNSRLDCGCKAGFINAARSVGQLECLPCSEGIDCPFSSSLASLQSGQPSSAQNLVTQVQMGYFATRADPLKLFRCRPLRRCPGGIPGTCAGGLEGELCAACPDGKSWGGSQCVDCGAAPVGWALGILLVLAVSRATYFFVNVEVTAQATPLKFAQLTSGVGVSTLQILALLGLSSAKWPNIFEGVSSRLQVFVLNLDDLHFGCFGGSSSMANYAMTALACPLLVVWMLICFACTQVTLVQRCGFRRWNLPHTLNTIGLGLQVGFGTIAAVSLKPFMCYKHPNGRSSVLSYPSVFCWEDGHGVMLALGVMSLAMVVVGFFAACSYAIWKLPQWSASGRNSMVQSFRFCTSNYQLNCYGFVLALLFRGLGFALAIAVGTDMPPVQTASVSVVLTLYILVQATMQPWKVPAINLADSVFTAGLLLLAGTAIQTDSQMESEFAEHFAGVVLLLVIALVFFLILLCGLVFLVNFLGGDFNRFLNLELRSRNGLQMAEALKLCAGGLMAIETVQLSGNIQSMNHYDVQTIINLISIFEADFRTASHPSGAYGNARVGLAALNARLSLHSGDVSIDDAVPAITYGVAEGFECVDETAGETQYQDIRSEPSHADHHPLSEQGRAPAIVSEDL